MFMTGQAAGLDGLFSGRVVKAKAATLVVNNDEATLLGFIGGVTNMTGSLECTLTSGRRRGGVSPSDYSSKSTSRASVGTTPCHLLYHVRGSRRLKFLR